MAGELKKLIIFVLAVACLFLFGCTLSVNPMDLAPSRKYSVVTDNNLGAVVSGSTGNNSGASADTNLQKVALNLSEVAKHTQVNDCWMIINGKVYDLSEYVGHPGGYTYVPYCGKDGTRGYDTKAGRGGMHSSYADSLLSAYLIGSLGQEVTINANGASSVVSQGTSTTQNQSTLPSQQRRNRTEDEYEWD